MFVVELKIFLYIRLSENIDGCSAKLPNGRHAQNLCNSFYFEFVFHACEVKLSLFNVSVHVHLNIPENSLLHLF